MACTSSFISWKLSLQSWPIDIFNEILIVLPGNTILAWFPSLDDVEDAVRLTRSRMEAPECSFHELLVSLLVNLELFAVELPSSSRVFGSLPSGSRGASEPLFVGLILCTIEFLTVLFKGSFLLRGGAGLPDCVTLDTELLCTPHIVCLRRSLVEGHRRRNVGDRRIAGGSRGS